MPRRVHVGFRLDPDELDEFNDLVAHRGIRRSEALREAVGMWLDDARLPQWKRNARGQLTVDQIREIAAEHGVDHLVGDDGVIRLEVAAADALGAQGPNYDLGEPA